MLSLACCGALEDEASGSSDQAQVVGAVDAGAAPAPPGAEALENAFRAFPPEGLCNARWCWIDPRPTDADFQVVAGTSHDDLWIGGATGGVLRWDGAALRVLPTGLASISSIEAIARDDVWLAGGGKVAHWDGRAFTTYNQSSGQIFRAGPSNLYIGGYGGFFEWTGSGFAHRGNIQEASAWAGTSPSDLWAAAGSRGLLHFDGDRWSEVDALRGHRVVNVFAFGPDDVWVVTNDLGDYRVVQRDGSAWKERYTTKSYIRSIVGTGASDRWLIGNDAIIHYDGRAFTVGPALPERIVGASIVGGVPYAVGWRGTVLRLSAEPKVDYRVISRAQGKMKAVWASASTDVWAAGQDGAAWNYDGRTLTPIETGVKVQLNDIGGTSSEDVWIVGNGGTVLHGSLASGFRTLPSGVSNHLTSVFAASPDEAWIGGAGVLLRATPTGITEVSLPWLKTSLVADIHGLAKNDIWAITNAGATHFDGTAWSAPYNASWGLTRIWALAPNNVWATGGGCGHGSCTYAHWTGTAWSSGFMSPPAELWAIPSPYDSGADRSVASWALGPNEIWSVTYNGAVLHGRRP